MAKQSSINKLYQSRWAARFTRIEAERTLEPIRMTDMLGFLEPSKGLFGQALITRIIRLANKHSPCANHCSHLCCLL